MYMSKNRDVVNVYESQNPYNPHMTTKDVWNCNDNRKCMITQKLQFDS